MSKQLIIAGFHRSGTSMLTQEIYNAGLFVGERLMSPNVSNVDGHFEDMDFFHLHEKLLRYNQSSWQYTDDEPLYVSEDYKKEMHRLIDQRDSTLTQWGFKDPRSVLFLEDWYKELSHPHTFVIYRHYSETTRSLLHRAAGDWLVNPQAHQLAFWQDETLAYKMWLSYNRKLIKHIQSHPETTLVVSQDAVIEGFPVIKELVARFQFELDIDAPSDIDRKKLSDKAKYAPPPSHHLQEELDAVWQELQRLSYAPAKEKTFNEFPSFTLSLGDIAERVKPLVDNTSEDDLFAETMTILQSDDISVKEKIEQVQKTMKMFFYTGQQEILIKMLESLLWKEKDSIELWCLLGDIYRLKKEEKEVYNANLQLMAYMPSVAPWNYQRIADGYSHFYRFDMSEYFLKKAIKGNPKNPSFYMSKANMEIARCRYSEALIALDKAIEFYDGKITGIATALVRKCEIYNFLDDKESLKKAIASIKTLKETKHNVHEWIEKSLRSFEEKQEEQIDFKKSWEEKLERRLKKHAFMVDLSYALKSIDDPLMKSDIIERMYERFKELTHEEIKKPTCIIVLGMHRSGTSCLMGSLEKYGLISGNISTWNPYNLKGNREHFDVVALNEKLLAFNGGSWDNPPDILRWNSELERERDAIIDDFLKLSAPFVGFKDPRTVFTLPFWEEGLNEKMHLKLVGSFRNPISVVDSLLNRNTNMTREAGMTLWGQYNDKLIEHYKKNPFPVISFDHQGEEYLNRVDRISKILGLGLLKNGKEHFYDDSLVTNHKNIMEEEIDSKLINLYHLLEEFEERTELFQKQKKLTVIVNFYNMRREAKRTLYTLSEEYQGMSADLYDVIVIDNNSSEPLQKEFVESFGKNFFYLYFNSTYPSPVEAMNFCAKVVGSEYIMCMIDGARMLSPGILKYSFDAWKLFEHPFVYTIGMHLGEQLQNISMENGYDQKVEDKLLTTVDWKQNGYELFLISSVAASSKNGFYSQISESNCFSLKREDFLAIGGFNEKFISPGAGLVNLDIFNQINHFEGIEPILLLGEASFHQFHGGVATNVPMDKHPMLKMKEEYKSIYGKNFVSNPKTPFYYGKIDMKYHRSLIGIKND